MSDFKYIIISLLVIFLIFLGIAMLVDMHETHQGVVDYNNSICIKCDGHYKYQQAVGHYVETNYIYICDKCGYLIEVNDYFEQ